MSPTVRKKSATSLPPKRGRPTKIDPDLINAICTNIAKPMPFKYACEMEGISERTGHDWLARGERGEEPFVAFSTAVTRARARGVAKLVDHSLQGGRGSQNATWHLERLHRQDYGPTQRIEHSGPDGSPIQINAKPLAEMSDEELTAAYKRLTGDRSGTLPPGD